MNISKNPIIGAKLRLSCEIKTILKVPNETSVTCAKNINKGSKIKEKNGFSKKNYFNVDFSNKYIEELGVTFQYYIKF